jgi:hypothetical protein
VERRLKSVDVSVWGHAHSPSLVQFFLTHMMFPSYMVGEVCTSRGAGAAGGRALGTASGVPRLFQDEWD